MMVGLPRLSEGTIGPRMGPVEAEIFDFNKGRESKASKRLYRKLALCARNYSEMYQSS
jgi:hypothetical protein